MDKQDKNLELKRKKIQGVLLDFGGTLVEEFPEDVDTLLIQLFTERGLVCKKRPVQGQDFWRRYWKEHYSGLPKGKRWTTEIRTALNLEMMKHYALSGNVEAVASELAAFSRSDWRSPLALFPDVKPTLISLRQKALRLGVVSQSISSSEEMIQELTARGIASYFDMVLTSESAELDKPDPRLYLEAVYRLGLEPHEVCHVGDSLVKDAEAANAAGLRGILLCRARAAKGPKGIEVITSLSELPDLL